MSKTLEIPMESSGTAAVHGAGTAGTFGELYRQAWLCWANPPQGNPRKQCGGRWRRRQISQGK